MSERAKLLAILGVWLVALCVPVHADSITTYNFSTTLSGGYGTTSGTFTYNATTNTFLSASISFFSSLFGNVSLSSTNPELGFLSVYGGVVKGDSILYTILLNPLNPGQYWVDGGIATACRNSSFQYTSVSEGGEFSYAMCSVLMMVLLVGVRRAKGR